MSPTYIHCPACGRAFDVASRAGCPQCRRAIAATARGERDRPAPRPLDEEVGDAVDRIARALAGAGRAEVGALAASLARSAREAVTAPGEIDGWRGAILDAVARAVRGDRDALVVVAPAAVAERHENAAAVSTLLWSLVAAALSHAHRRAQRRRARQTLGRRALGLLRRAIA